MPVLEFDPVPVNMKKLDQFESHSAYPGPLSSSSRGLPSSVAAAAAAAFRMPLTPMGMPMMPMSLAMAVPNLNNLPGVGNLASISTSVGGRGYGTASAASVGSGSNSFTDSEDEADESAHRIPSPKRAG